MEDDFEDLVYEADAGIAVLTIDRPSVHNAFTERTIKELNRALDDALGSEGIYALVLTGADGGFCAGADVNEMPDWAGMGKAPYGAFLEEVQAVVSHLQESATPTIAAVGGPAIGAGCDFALACDFRLVGPDAVLREGFVNVGLVPGDGGAWLLPRLVGEAKAREYLLTGEDITPEAAVDMGLARGETETPVEDAVDLAEQLRDLPREAVRRTNQLVDPEQSFDEYCERAIDAQWACVTDEEHEEAVAAFRERREPEFDRDYT